MRNFLIILLGIIFSVSCASQPKPKAVDATIQVISPDVYSYVVKATYPHSRDSYTQGLQYHDGKLWEGTGLEGSSVLQRVDLSSGKVELLAALPDNQFGEGITVLGDKVYQLTWTSNKVHIYDLQGKRQQVLNRSGEGWGLTTDGTTLYMSDGTDKIYRVNPETFRRESYISVTRESIPVGYVNELEWIEGKIWANVYLSDEILIINPTSGVVEGVIDMSGLLSDAERKPDTDVLNGIAYDAEQKRIFVTGKRWPKIYQIEIQKR